MSWHVATMPAKNLTLRGGSVACERQGAAFS